MTVIIILFLGRRSRSEKGWSPHGSGPRHPFVFSLKTTGWPTWEGGRVPGGWGGMGDTGCRRGPDHSAGTA